MIYVSCLQYFDLPVLGDARLEVLLPADPDLVVVAKLVDPLVPDHGRGLLVVHDLGALGASLQLIQHVN